MSIFQTFSRSGKLLGKVPDFFKNTRLCTNPASREIQNNSNFVEQIHKTLREKKGSLLCSRSGWSHAKRWGICFRFVSCLQFFFFFFFHQTVSSSVFENCCVRTEPQFLVRLYCNNLKFCS